MVRHIQNTVIYSYLTEGKESGHLILDDTFWIEYFLNNNIQPLIYASNYSASIQKTKFPSIENNIRVIPPCNRIGKINSRLKAIMKILLSPRIKKSTVVIQGFEEISLWLLFLKNLGGHNRYILVLTNNITKKRLSKGGKLLKFLFKRLFAKSHMIFYHSDYEFNLIKTFISPSIEHKFKYVKYHLMCKSEQKKDVQPETQIISFFGPIKVDKPIDSFLQLIIADVQCKFQYKIYNPGIVDQSVFKSIASLGNVSIIDNFLDDDEYKKAILESRYIFLSHNSLYEGKLSGNLCDCIYYSIPGIADQIHPLIEYCEKYGNIGYVYSFENDKEWIHRFLTEESTEKRNAYISSIHKLQSEYTLQALTSELNTYLLH